MEEKIELVKKIEEKGLTIPKVAEAIEFSPNLLSLYLVDDAFPIPKRIMEKVTALVAS